MPAKRLLAAGAILACLCSYAWAGEPIFEYTSGIGLLRAKKYSDAAAKFAQAKADNDALHSDFREGVRLPRVGSINASRDWTPAFLRAYAAYRSAAVSRDPKETADVVALLTGYIDGYAALTKSSAEPPAIAYYLRGLALGRGAPGLADLLRAKKLASEEKTTGIEKLDAKAIPEDDQAVFGSTTTFAKAISAAIGGYGPILTVDWPGSQPIICLPPDSSDPRIPFTIVSWDRSGQSVKPTVEFNGAVGMVSASGDEWVAVQPLSFLYPEPQALSVQAHANDLSSPVYRLEVIPAAMPPPLFDAVRK